MSWGNGWVLLALALPLAAAIAIRRHAGPPSRRRWPGIQRVAITGRRVRPAAPPRLHAASTILIVIALAIVGAARPRWGEQEDASYTQSREVIITLDLSQSMLTEDVEPSRLERAKAITEQLLDALHGESVGLAVFAGTAFVQVPLSPDFQIIREFIPHLGPDYMPQGGSNYASMLDAALDGFSESDDRDRFLIVLSDGESSTGGWQSRLDDLVDRDVQVIALGMGTEDGGFIADPVAGGYLVDREGNAIHSRLMPATLQTLARRTHGTYINATALKDRRDVGDVLADTVDAGRRGHVRAEERVVQTERFQWFLLPAALLGLLSLFKEFRHQPRPRQVRPPVPSQQDLTYLPVVAAAATALLCAVTAPPAADAHYDDEAGFEVRAMFDSDPIQRVRAIAAHLAEFDYDAFDLRLMVEETLRYGADSQRTGTPIEEGVVRDAIEATVQGERLDGSIADWPYYRAQLEKMLPSSDEADTEQPSEAERRQLMDEEDSQPVVAGQSTQRSADDSFGQGASTRTDAALGELSLDAEITVEGRRRPPAAAAQAATARPANSRGELQDDPILQFSKQRLEEVVRRDSPGRLHQLMVEDAAQQNGNEFDW